MSRGDVHVIMLPRASGHELAERRYGVVVHSGALADALDATLVTADRRLASAASKSELLD